MSSPVRAAISVRVVGASKKPRSRRTLQTASASMSFSLNVTVPCPLERRWTVTEPVMSIGRTSVVQELAAALDDEPVVGDADGAGVALGDADGAGVAVGFAVADGFADGDGEYLGDGEAAMTTVAPTASAATAAIPANLRMLVAPSRSRL